VRGERGQASLEWVGLVLLLCLACATAVAAGVGAIDGRPLGADIARALVCAVRGTCEDADDALRDAYGDDDAALVRRYLPNLVYEPRTRTIPVDFRECRSHECSDAPDEENLDVHRGSGQGGAPATVFTRLIRDGGETFIQYWLYYPDSTSTVLGLAGLWNTVNRLPLRGRRPYPGYHEDDWESVQVRIDRDGNEHIRASSHKGYSDWAEYGGWSRVSYGSHAGHIPQPIDADERTTTAPGLRLVPVESLTPAERATDFEVTPPWDKAVYLDPRSDSTD
jgi:hypothetical protein